MFLFGYGQPIVLEGGPDPHDSMRPLPYYLPYYCSLLLLLPGVGVVSRGMATSSDVHHRHVSHNRRVGHRRLERDPPQDGHTQQPRAWLPRPQLPGQRHRWARSAGRRGRLSTGLPAVDFLQCFDTVGWVMWPVKLSPRWPMMCRVLR